MILHVFYFNFYIKFILINILIFSLSLSSRNTHVPILYIYLKKKIKRSIMFFLTLCVTTHGEKIIFRFLIDETSINTHTVDDIANTHTPFLNNCTSTTSSFWFFIIFSFIFHFLFIIIIIIVVVVIVIIIITHFNTITI